MAVATHTPKVDGRRDVFILKNPNGGCAHTMIINILIPIIIKHIYKNRALCGWPYNSGLSVLCWRTQCLVVLSYPLVSRNQGMDPCSNPHMSYSLNPVNIPDSSPLYNALYSPLRSLDYSSYEPHYYGNFLLFLHSFAPCEPEVTLEACGSTLKLPITLSLLCSLKIPAKKCSGCYTVYADPKNLKPRELGCHSMVKSDER